MEIWEKIGEILKKIPKDYYLPIGVGCIGLILFVYGFFTILNKNQSRENIQQNNFSQPSITANSGSTKLGSDIKIDVEGAVASPGVYTISSEARAQDGLIAAGGLSGNADRQWVAQHINLATKLTDGTKIYIPAMGETQQTAAAVAATDQTVSSNVLGASTSQQTNINTASSSDLDALPGIGPATAQKIIAGRPYASTQDLLTNKIVGAKEFEKIKNLITSN